MRKWLVLSVLIICLALLFYPFQRALVMTETKTDTPKISFLLLNSGIDFQMIFTHSIHLSDVIESYHVLASNEIKLVSMQYSDVAIGMPSYAEQNQELTYQNGLYTLRYNDRKLPNFTLYIADIDQKLVLSYGGIDYDLKSFLTKGKSYLIEVRNISLYEKWKGAIVND